MTQDDLALRITGLRPGETPFLFSNLLAQTQSPLPSQTSTFSRLRWALQNKNRCPLRGSHDNRSRTRPYSPSNPLRISVTPAARYIRVAGPSPNTAYTRSSRLTRRSNVLVSKSGCTSTRRPPGSTTVSPQLGSCCVGDFSAANSTGTKQPAEEIGLRLLFRRSFFRWRSSVLKLKPRLWQNSLRRIPLLTNSATNC